jgi:predicted transcriptional regulator
MAKRETKSITITARITPSLNKKLLALAKAGKRTKSQTLEFLIADHIDDDLDFVAMVQEGIRSAEEHGTVPNEEAMRQLRAHIAKRKREKRKAA